MTIMAIRDLIPWSRQENRLPVPVSAKRDQEPDHHPLLSLHREVNRLFDDVFRGFGIPGFGGVGRDLAWPHVELGATDTAMRVTAEIRSEGRRGGKGGVRTGRTRWTGDQPKKK